LLHLLQSKWLPKTSLRLDCIYPLHRPLCSEAQVHAWLLEFARLAARLRGSCEALEDPEQRAIWRQRGTWLHEE
jgi:hypothetical protein